MVSLGRIFVLLPGLCFFLAANSSIAQSVKNTKSLRVKAHQQIITEENLENFAKPKKQFPFACFRRGTLVEFGTLSKNMLVPGVAWQRMSKSKKKRLLTRLWKKRATKLERKFMLEARLKNGGDSSAVAMRLKRVVATLRKIKRKIGLLQRAEAICSRIDFDDEDDDPDSGDDDKEDDPNSCAEDSTAPVIVSLDAENPSSESFSFLVRLSEPASIRLEYGRSRAFENSLLTDTYSEQHSIILNSLSDESVYFYRLIAIDRCGNGSVAKNGSFKTAQKLMIVDLRASLSHDRSMLISWETLIATTATLRYASEREELINGGGERQESALAMFHGFILKGLIPGKDYFAIAESTADDGTVTTQSIHFRVPLEEHHKELINPDHASLVLHTDMIPNFAQTPTARSVQSGLWEDPSTWEERRVPRYGDVVRISQGTQVLVSSNQAEASVIGIEPKGRLEFMPDRDTSLKVATLLVFPGGELIVGTVTQPISDNHRAEIVIADEPINFSVDPEQFGTGIISLGRVRMHGAAKNRTWMRLLREPQAGDTQLILEAPVEGWHKGDMVFIPDSRQGSSGLRKALKKGEFTDMRWEEAVIESIASDGRTVILERPLSHSHPGARDENGELVYLPHVALLTRNIVIRSDNPEGTRGHILFHGRADTDMRYVQISDMGRTEAARLSNAVWEARIRNNENGDIYTLHVEGGKIKDPFHQLPYKWIPRQLPHQRQIVLYRRELRDTTQVGEWKLLSTGTNQIARYSLHNHHVIGPQNASNTGYQFVWIGNCVNSFKRLAYVIHGSSYGLVRDNIAYKGQGTGFFIEDGTEIENELIRNFAARLSGTVDDSIDDVNAGDYGKDGNGFQAARTGNIFRDNVATNILGWGFLNVGYGFSHVRVPAYRGAMPHMANQGVDMLVSPPGVFAGNEVYGMTSGGYVSVWPSSTDIATMIGNQLIISNLKIWHTHHTAVEDWHSADHLYEGLDIVFNPQELGVPTDNFETATIGIDFRGYEADRMIIRNARIIGGRIGITTPSADRGVYSVPEPTLIQNVLLKNYWNVMVSHPHQAKTSKREAGGSAVLLDNVRFLAMEQKAEATVLPANIRIPFRLVGEDYRLLYLNRLYIKDLNGEPAKNYQVFRLEQHPDFIVPVTEHNRVSVDVAGFSNRQWWNSAGVAIGGEPAPCDDSACSNMLRIRGIDGYAWPID